MLGYGLGVPELGSPYGPAGVDEEFQYTEISCKGDEENLLDCSLKVSRGCSRGMVAGVTCFYSGRTPPNNTPEPTTTTTTTTTTTSRPSSPTKAPSNTEDSLLLITG